MGILDFQYFFVDTLNFEESVFIAKDFLNELSLQYFIKRLVFWEWSHI